MNASLEYLWYSSAESWEQARKDEEEEEETVENKKGTREIRNMR
jgi:hypothetical protein